MRQKIDLQDIWELARQQAEASLRRYHEDVAPNLPEQCPFGLDELLAKKFDYTAAIARLSPEGKPSA
jgi:hypothetical protein